MSGSPTNFAGTLTGGIQDISALLPIIGTDQCEKHVGSALDGGFLYAVATPLSLFGSLGIVKAGISVLVASISIPKLSLSPPKISFNESWFDGISIPVPSLKCTPLPKLAFRSFQLLSAGYKTKLSFELPKLSFTSSQRIWCGARVLDNAGFKLVGSVAPLIGMDGKRYKAESRLIKILEEKHIDTPENLSVDWKSAEWNISLVIGTIIAGLISGTPYLYLLLKDPPESIHSPWVFPLLRAVGSCLATVCCQFLIQSRVISLMKSRIVFMIMHRHLVNDLEKGNHDESILKEQKQFRWDERFPTEECLWSLEQYLLSRCPSVRHSGSFRRYMLLLKARFQGLVHILLSKIRIPAAQVIETHPRNLDVLEQWMRVLRQSEHSPPDAEADDVEPYPDPYLDPDDIPLFSDPEHILHALLREHAEHFRAPQLHRTFIVLSWFLLLVSLPASVAGYIGCFTLVANSRSSGPLVWLGLEAVLSALRILLWAWNPSFDEGTKVEVRLKLTGEGPPVTTQWDIDVLHAINCQVPLVPERRFLEQRPLDLFEKPDNTALYFAVTVNKEHTLHHLFMTFYNWTSRAAFTLYNISKDEIVYAHTEVTSDTNSGEMLALIQWDSAVSVNRTRRIDIHDLEKYYRSLVYSLTRSKVASLHCRWSLVPEFEDETQSRESTGLTTGSLIEYDFLYLQQSHEHHLKTQLMETWGKWIVDSVEVMYCDGRNDCYHALADPTDNKAKRELYAFNVLLVQEWTKRELAHLQLSAALENVLRSHVQRNREKLANGGQWKMTFSLEWSYDLQKRRLENERAQVKARGKTLVKRRSKWQDDFASIWQAGQAFIEEKWAAVAESMSFEESLSGVTTEHEWFGGCDDEMRILVEKLKPRFPRWNDQCSCERREMEATVEQISKADAKQLEQAYEYPELSKRLAGWVYSRFVKLPYNSEERAFVAKVSSATVYDVEHVSFADIIHIAKESSCRSLIRVHSYWIPQIPENDNLLFCSGEDLQEIDLPFVQRNRSRWWEQQKTNSWTFYLSPGWVDSNGQYVYRYYKGAIAHIMVFLQMPTRLRLQLLHCQSTYGDDDAMELELSIQAKDREIRRVHSAEITKGNHRWQDYDLDWFEPGRHELQLLSQGWYFLRDIVVEFVSDPSSDMNHYLR